MTPKKLEMMVESHLKKNKKRELIKRRVVEARRRAHLETCESCRARKALVDKLGLGGGGGLIPLGILRMGEDPDAAEVDQKGTEGHNLH